ncbi:hypothetical protein HK405_005941 [Cladochytrium tenue]|nr:hypothetical protein HK405_005941 [Cladochytrium tenue]
MIIGSREEDGIHKDFSPINIEIPPQVVQDDILEYSKYFFHFCGSYNDKFTLQEAAIMARDLSSENFSAITLAEHLIKLNEEEATRDILDGLAARPETLTVPEYLLIRILQEYLYTPDVNFVLLVDILCALARPRVAAPTVASLAIEAMNTEAEVALTVRQLDSLVTIHRLSTAGNEAEDSPAVLTLASSLVAACVNRLDHMGLVDRMLSDSTDGSWAKQP